jgi:MFS family permease
VDDLNQHPEPDKRGSSSTRQQIAAPERGEPVLTLGGPLSVGSGEPELYIAHSVGPQPAQTEVRASLFNSDRFLAFWLSRFLGQIAQGALMYGLLVLVVDTTDSSVYNSIFVVCAVIPAIFFGLPAGVAVDSLPRRPLLFTLNLLRFLFVLALVVQPPALAGIFATTLAIWVIHQFYSPAESSTLASIVPANRLVDAQALSNLALIIAQAIGLIALAPLILKTSDPRYLFAICATLFLTSALLVLQLDISELAGTLASKARHPDGVLHELLAGLRLTTKDPILFRVTATDVMVGIGLSALVVIAPIYLRRILNTASENTVFVFAPAAIGVLLGLKTAPALSRLFGLRLLATAGLVGFAMCIAAYGFMADIYWLVNDTLNVPIASIAHTLRIAPLALMVMLFSVPAGFASSVVGVSARTVTLERAPKQFRGQVIATQSLVQNLGALVPTMLAGIAADQIGVERVAVIIAFLMIAGMGAAFFVHRPPAAAMAPAS